MSPFDRRHDRRKKLPADFTVELHPQELADGGPALVGRAADLTMGGVGVVLAEEIHPDLHGEIWTVRVALPDKAGRPVPLHLAAVITHGRPDADGYFYGLKFVEINAPHRSAERAALRQYLLSDLREQWQGKLPLQAPVV